jgi:hypothetical protein
MVDVSVLVTQISPISPHVWSYQASEFTPMSGSVTASTSSCETTSSTLPSWLVVEPHPCEHPLCGFV